MLSDDFCESPNDPRIDLPFQDVIIDRESRVGQLFPVDSPFLQAYEDRLESIAGQAGNEAMEDELPAARVHMFDEK